MVEANDFNDTLGAGSYPEPPETYYKEYTFTLKCLTKVKVSTLAKNQEEAEKEIKEEDLLQSDYDIFFENLKVEDIISCEVEELD